MVRQDEYHPGLFAHKFWKSEGLNTALIQLKYMIIYHMFFCYFQ